MPADIVVKKLFLLFGLYLTDPLRHLDKGVGDSRRHHKPYGGGHHDTDYRETGVFRLFGANPDLGGGGGVNVEERAFTEDPVAEEEEAGVMAPGSAEDRESEAGEATAAESGAMEEAEAVEEDARVFTGEEAAEGPPAGEEESGKEPPAEPEEEEMIFGGKKDTAFSYRRAELKT